MSNIENSKSPVTSDEEYFENLQQDLSTFPSDIYNISNLELITSDTPSISPNISPTSAPKPGTVKNYSSLFTNLEAGNIVANNTRGFNLRNKMGKVTRIKKAYGKFK